MARKIKMLAVLAAMVLGFGCSTAPTVDRAENLGVTPTHRWVSELDVSRTRYNFDNKRCADQAAMSVALGRHAGRSNEGIRTTDPEFRSYQRCMESRGYTLATY